MSWGLRLRRRFRHGSVARAKPSAARCMRAGKPPAVVRAPPGLRARRRWMRRSGWCMEGCIRHFIGNFPAFAQGDREKAVHQMRVAMRRLRSVLGVFNRAFPNAAFATFRAQAKAMASDDGRGAGLGCFYPADRGWAGFGVSGGGGFAAVLQRRRRSAMPGMRRCEKMLSASTETTRFVLALQGSWRGMAGAMRCRMRLAEVDGPARVFAAVNVAAAAS